MWENAIADVALTNHRRVLPAELAAAAGSWNDCGRNSAITEWLTSVPEAQTLPTTVLTGFLGSGKTTLLRRALVSPALSDTAVIINEIGEIAIDHHLVDFVEGSVLELPGGCLCCTVREDLARTLRSLLERRAAGGITWCRRDHVVPEEIRTRPVL